MYLHRLNCGSPDDMMENDDPDADNDDDEEEIANAIEDLNNVLEGFMDKKDEDENPLLGLAGSCTNILSSPLGSGSLGRASSIITKAGTRSSEVRLVGRLKPGSCHVIRFYSPLLDSEVIKLLLGAIGAVNEDPMDVDEADEEVGRDDDSDENSADEDVFSKVAGLSKDDNNMDNDKPEK